MADACGKELLITHIKNELGSSIKTDYAIALGRILASHDKRGREAEARLFVTLANRAADKEVARWLSELGQYNGQDQIIHGGIIGTIGEEEFSTLPSGATALDHVQRAYACDVAREPRGFRGRPSFDFSVHNTLALSILEKPLKYPAYLLAASDRKLSANAGSIAAKVGEVAKKDGWFP